MRLLTILSLLLSLALCGWVDRASAEQSPPASSSVQPSASVAYSYPIGVPGRPLGDGFFIRHGYTVENTWFNPGYWHTGEDWYATEGDAAGARVYAVASGVVVYTGSNYPGRVVIVQHEASLFSMYGHLDPKLRVRTGQRVVRGAPLGVVLRRADKVPNHLHFEIRTFLLQKVVNGDEPRYPFRCGKRCPPGPGYWPQTAPDLPVQLGWRNPTHELALRAGLRAGTPGSTVVVATRPVSTSTTLWSAPPGTAKARVVGELRLRPGERFPLLDLVTAPTNQLGTGAQAYHLWYRIQLADRRQVWVQAAIPTPYERGSDGRASTVSLNWYPAVLAP